MLCCGQSGCVSTTNLQGEGFLGLAPGAEKRIWGMCVPAGQMCSLHTAELTEMPWEPWLSPFYACSGQEDAQGRLLAMSITQSQFNTALHPYDKLKTSPGWVMLPQEPL